MYSSISFRVLPLFLVLSLLLSIGSYAQDRKKRKAGSVYFSWGYNKEWYTNSTVHVKQPAQGNYYKLMAVEAHDHPGWDEKGSIFGQQLTIPQYNYRLGYYFNEEQDLAIELNFDHTKYIVAEGQTVRMKGTYNHRPTDSNIVFSAANGNYYYLNNGANFFLFNIVKRWGLLQSKSNNLRVDFLGKAGIGPLIPHVENSFFGQKNDPHFQIGGWNVGLETALRATVYRYAYLEFAQKVDYARYSNLKILGGTARQAFGTYEFILSLGFIVPTTKHNPMFAKQVAEATAGQ